MDMGFLPFQFSLPFVQSCMKGKEKVIAVLTNAIAHRCLSFFPGFFHLISSNMAPREPEPNQSLLVVHVEMARIEDLCFSGNYLSFKYRVCKNIKEL